MVAGSPVQGLTSTNSSVAPWNDVVGGVAGARAGPAMSPSSRGTSSKHSFRAMWHSFAYKSQRELARQGGAGKPASSQQHHPPFSDAEIPRSTHGTAGKNRHGSPCGSISRSPQRRQNRSWSRR